MPRRRPPRDGHVVNNLFLFAAAILFLPWLVDAQQQQRPDLQQRHESPHEADEHNNPSSHTLEVTKVAQNAETPLTYGRRKNTLINIKDKNDASAVTTLAPAENAVGAPSSRKPTAGLSSPQIARNIGDWEVEDFVLLATVDGKLHARDRKTGKERWDLSYEQPMVHTQYHPRNHSVERGFEPTAIDSYLWIVEPSRDGTLYIYRPDGPNQGLANTGLTMKRLVEEMSPYGDEDPPVMYTGEKKTNLVTVDANTGKVLSWFGTVGSMVEPSCNVDPDDDSEETEKCPKVATLTIGRTEYTVGIHGRKDGHHIATLTFSEWSPNNYDQDLQRQYLQSATTLDNKYIYTGHDGGVIGFDHERSNGMGEPGLLFNHKFSSPVVRVFDVARPWGADKNAPDLIILPQPLPPNHEDRASAYTRASSIFLNHTEDGSWFAMSGKSYPLAIGGIKPAKSTQEGWLTRHPRWDIMNKTQLAEALVGLHSIDPKRPDTDTSGLLTISAPSDDDNQTIIADEGNLPAIVEDTTVLDHVQKIPRIAIDYVLEFIKNPILLLMIIGALITYQREIRIWIGRHGGHKYMSPVLAGTSTKLSEEPPDVEAGIPSDKPIEISSTDGSVDPVPTKVEDLVASNSEVVDRETDPAKGEISEGEKPSAEVETPKKAKKAHRGRRGGVKHRKRTTSQDASLDGNTHKKAEPTIEENVAEALKLGPQTKLEPDIRTIPSDPQEVSGPIIRIGALEVNTEKLIGTGSNGTMVFEGNFDGREVAVKRMLIQFFDIASQETKLLRESDDHPNVIRYFAQQQAAGFLYIALELCPASLADVIDKPHNHRELAQAGEKDLPNVLYQITNGLQHLHKLRIVHRDLKPQNILVAMGKDGRPRLLVSDFGLCKKLEGEQSSFRATTAHAAGTSGWRAPELLLDDDANHGHHGLSLVDASTDGNSGSIALGTEIPGNRRATRAIDIFSLGLVFFYVLTKGSHPFDCGDRFMREVNIRKGSYDLRALEVLGDYTFEARDLIASMLAAEPKQRPQAHQVMAHPFFWSAKKRLNFLCDVSDHFEKEKRDPPSDALKELESYAASVCGSDFLKLLGKDFVESMGKQRKYTGTRLLDLLRALRNKKNHYEDMSDKLKKDVGPLPDGYLSFWTRRFPNLLITCWNVVFDVQWDDTDRFREYYLPAGL